MSSSSSNQTNSANGPDDDLLTDHMNPAATTGTYPFTQTSFASSHTSGSCSSSSNSTTTDKPTNSSTTTFIRKSSRQVTPSVKRSPFCYPLMNIKDKDEADICFAKHVDCIKKRNKNRIAKMKGNKGRFTKLTDI
jgi:hypothetical protein